MEWNRLLSSSRIARPDYQAEIGRNSYQQDLDRIVYSGAFRRLANKTQVHPLAENDHVHNRLTHSIETGSVGRSLGTMVGSRICDLDKDGNLNFTPDDLGYVLQAACLAHDIGNPPFGHAGEAAIGDWFKQKTTDKNSLYIDLSKIAKSELCAFEGNAQGFRILTQLENHKWEGGLQLTHAVLGTFMKYPRPAFPNLEEESSYKGFKKFGYFSSERNCVKEVADTLGMKKYPDTLGYWYRHPLAFLVEAADDICYNIIDLEDAFLMTDLPYDEVANLLEPLAPNLSFNSNMTKADKIAYLRAVAIGSAVKEVAEVFCNNESALLDGAFSSDLVSNTKYAEAFENIQKIASRRIFTGPLKTEKEIAGRSVIHGLLDIYSDVVCSLHNNGWKPEGVPQHIKRLIRHSNLDFRSTNDLYSATLVVTDFISGMTDRYAKVTYQKLSGYF